MLCYTYLGTALRRAGRSAKKRLAAGFAFRRSRRARQTWIQHCILVIAFQMFGVTKVTRAGKLAPRSTPGNFVSYDVDDNDPDRGYKILDLRTGQVAHARAPVIFEDQTVDGDHVRQFLSNKAKSLLPKMIPLAHLPVVDIPDTCIPLVELKDSRDEEENDSDEEDANENAKSSDASDASEPATVGSNKAQKNKTSKKAKKKTKSSTKKSTKIYALLQERDQEEKVPTTFAEAISCSSKNKWIAAMEAEYNSQSSSTRRGSRGSDSKWEK
ncbi:hypothetical protein SDRG_06876 [Saprolegnia diclina VS20]|uniref:Uncharacterized protein n=1 Tax=Saprolegnia diclina (strain VS20) TaxID=1156394 RepID=T0RZ31_SAPDV|nr:hypothetical protein SDRG_06876 [Saprolegnia diclina VS20]EQC35587.1 hypothetical protein SDRG_06876 [Saprolegnia diclina VS20]|eukprot:XP_008610904.1 hypothetical protein SDRG_06876 [Saprolegnia diclina VS20]